MILVGIGSNLGDVIANTQVAMHRIAAWVPGGSVRKSGLWRTKPLACPPGSAPFINAVVAFPSWPGLEPAWLLMHLQKLERAFGRAEIRAPNAPRHLDLDLLLFDDRVSRDPALTLPHPRACQRQFVLAPAAELVPEIIWPGCGLTIRELLALLPERAWGERLFL